MFCHKCRTHMAFRPYGYGCAPLAAWSMWILFCTLYTRTASRQCGCVGGWPAGHFGWTSWSSRCTYGAALRCGCACGGAVFPSVQRRADRCRTCRVAPWCGYACAHSGSPWLRTTCCNTRTGTASRRCVSCSDGSDEPAPWKSYHRSCTGRGRQCSPWCASSGAPSVPPSGWNSPCRWCSGRYLREEPNIKNQQLHWMTPLASQKGAVSAELVNFSKFWTFCFYNSFEFFSSFQYFWTSICFQTILTFFFLHRFDIFPILFSNNFDFFFPFLQFSNFSNGYDFFLFFEKKNVWTWRLF